MPVRIEEYQHSYVGGGKTGIVGDAASKAALAELRMEDSYFHET